MKNKLVITALATGLISSAAFADDGKINFTGAITDDACTVVNPVANPLEVQLGTVSRTAFSGAGDTAAPTKFTIKLSNCPASLDGKTSQVKFDGTAADGDTNVLALTQETGVAEGVGVQITDKNNIVVPLFTASSAYPLQTGDNNLDFTARYYATSSTINAGPANATATFSIIYN